MTADPNQKILTRAHELSKSLAANSRSDVSAKILKVDEACRKILENGGLVTMKSVRAWLSTNAGFTIAPQTLMNKRTDKSNGRKIHSPFRQIIDKYAEAQTYSSKGVIKSKGAPPAELNFLSDNELSSISCHQTRYKVQLLVGRLRNLENQINHLRTISSLPSLSASIAARKSQMGAAGGAAGALDITSQIPDEAEIEALKDFASPNALKRRGLAFDSVGRLVVTHPASKERKTARLSAPELRGALEKIIKSI